MKAKKTPTSAEQRKILSLENRITELEDRIQGLEEIDSPKYKHRFKDGEYVQLMGKIINVDSDSRNPYEVEIQWESQDEFPSLWLPEDALQIQRIPNEFSEDY